MNRRTRRRRLLMAAGLGAAAAVAGAAWSWRRSTAAHDAATQGLWDARFEAPDGTPWTMARLRGKPVVVNFWATWCAPCIKELPQFERFHREYSARGWQVVGLAIDSPAAVTEFLRRTPVSFPIGLAGMEGTELMLGLGNQHSVLPFTIVLDSGGNVVQKRVGETRFEELQAWAAKTA